MTAGRPGQPPTDAARTSHRRSWLLLGAALVQVAWYYPRLPARVASHFDFAGQATGFMPKPAFFLFYAGVLALMSVIFHLTPLLVARLPEDMINLPNRAYWWAPEHRALAIAKVRAFSAGFGDGTLLFLLLVFRDVMHANRLDEPHLTIRILVFVGAFVVFAVVWTGRLVRGFRLPS